MTTETFTKAQLALLCWRNAPEKNLNVLKALAFVVRNRVRAGWHGGEWLAVIANDYLYGYRALGVPPLEQEFPDLRGDTFQRFLWEVDRIYDGSAGDPLSEGALYWAPAGYPLREWFEQKITRQPEEHPRVAQVAQVMLWK